MANFIVIGLCGALLVVVLSMCATAIGKYRHILKIRRIKTSDLIEHVLASGYDPLTSHMCLEIGRYLEAQFPKVNVFQLEEHYAIERHKTKIMGAIAPYNTLGGYLLFPTSAALTKRV